MRPDMSKVLVERPRVGRYSKRKGRPARDPDLLRAKATGRRLAHENGGAKSFGENLAPLRRYIERQEGRPWNKVFSEMREHIKPGNTVQEHILTHLDNYIAFEVDRVEPSQAAPCGLAYSRSKVFRYAPKIEPGTLYVDPVDGIIKRARRKLKGPRFAIATAEQAIRHMAYGRWAISVGGVWNSIGLIAYQLEGASDVLPTAFKVGYERRVEWADPFDGIVKPWDKAKLAVLQKRYGKGLLAYDLQPLSRQQRQRYQLRDARGA